MNKKIIILHDTFLYKGWWERLIMMMWKILKSDIASGFFSKWSFDLRKEWFKWKIIPLSNEIFAKGFRHIKLKLAFLFKTAFLNKYDIVIFSWDCISAVNRIKNKSTKNIYYCHTPPRYLYDLKEIYLSKLNFSLRPIFNIASYVFRKMYERDIKKMDVILTNSENTRKRIKDFIWYDSYVLYPPVDMKEFKYQWQKDYYLSFARLSTVKRVDLIVEAFKLMPDKKIIVIYWENDPQRNDIFNIAKWYKNITFITLPWNIWFTDYIWNCIATIYIPINEDFWMSPVESMAAWKPVIWVNDWWLKETIINKKTGLLLKKDIAVNDIIYAVNYLTPEKSYNMRLDCENRAKDFNLNSFNKKIKTFI